MRRLLNLRQVEAFKSVIENGTVRRAAQLLFISQPAVSKLIGNLEADLKLELFERVKGRLVPTERGMRFYEEVDRIFSGLRQLENAADAIRRQEQGSLTIGVMPTIGSCFIQDVTTTFLKASPEVYCTIFARTSAWLGEWLHARRLDVAIVNWPIDTSFVATEVILEEPLVCIMPADHPLAARDVVEPHDIDGVPFVSYGRENLTADSVTRTLDRYGVTQNVVLSVNLASTLNQFVAAGTGISIVHPLNLRGVGPEIAIRRFEPSIKMAYELCWLRDSRNQKIIDQFVEETRCVAKRVSSEIGALT